MAASTAPAPGRRSWLPFSGWHLFLMPLALVFATPLVQMILTSLKTDADIRKYPPDILPTHPTLDGFIGLFAQTKLAGVEHVRAALTSKRSEV